MTFCSTNTMHRTLKKTGLLLVVTVLFLSWMTGPGYAGTIYMYEDEQGCLHFTDLPTSDAYRPFLVFRDHQDVDHGEILKLVRKYSRQYGMDEHLIQAVVAVESGYEPLAVSRAGAQGLMQIMPETQRDLGVTEPFDPDCNIEAGVRYLRKLLNDFGDVRHALAAYNAGPSKVVKYRGIPPYKETQQYVKKVLALYDDLKAGQ